MNRHKYIAGLLLAGVVTLGTTACAGSTEPVPPTTTKTVTTTVEPPAEPASTCVMTDGAVHPVPADAGCDSLQLKKFDGGTE